MLSDVGMLGTRGFDLLRTVKCDPFISTIPFTFLNNDSRSESNELVQKTNPFSQQSIKDETFVNPIDKAFAVKAAGKPGLI